MLAFLRIFLPSGKRIGCDVNRVNQTMSRYSDPAFTCPQVVLVTTSSPLTRFLNCLRNIHHERSKQAMVAPDPLLMDALPGEQMYVTGIMKLPVTACTTNLPVSLMDHITELFRLSGKIDAQNAPYTSPSPLDSDIVHCVKQLFEQDAEGLAREAYCFMPTNHNVADLDPRSFEKFQRQWECDYGKSGKGDGRFSEVRKRNAIKPFSKCTLRCMCGTCCHGKAVELQCDACEFGTDHMVSESLFEAQRLADTFQILIHEFPWDGQIWAVTLGTRDDPEEYSIWGKIDDNTRQISYHNRILLKEVMPAELHTRSGRYIVDAGDGDEFTQTSKFDNKRTWTSTASIASKRRRTLAQAAGDESVQKDMRGSGKTTVHTTISDDEENMKPSQLGASGRKTPAGSVGGESSSVTPVPARVPGPQQATTTIQEPHEHDFKEWFLDTRAH
jgi:hypothetical protein